GRQVTLSSTISGEAVTESERTDALVTSLVDTARRIGDVTGLISDIAAQTNLLALN
ncbi:MAG TPA: chemotaxis protein, partial [Tistrella mobilis]|nr:chemotaxis protein [Tistrella mobilis]